MKKDSFFEISSSKEFQHLVASRWKVSLLLTIIMLVMYFGFLILVAFKKELLAMKLSSGLTLAIPIGIGILVFTWLMTGIYVRWANQSYDKQVEELRKKIQ